MLIALILVCSWAAVPEPSACSSANAAMVIAVPGAFWTPQACAMESLEYAAGVAELLDEESYIRVGCMRRPGAPA